MRLTQPSTAPTKTFLALHFHSVSPFGLHWEGSTIVAGERIAAVGKKERGELEDFQTGLLSNPGAIAGRSVDRCRDYQQMHPTIETQRSPTTSVYQAVNDWAGELGQNGRDCCQSLME